MVGEVDDHQPAPHEKDAALIDSTGIIKKPEEIEAVRRAEEDREEKSYRQLYLEAETRQANSQQIQAKASRAIVSLTFGLVIVSLVSGVVSYFQFTAANKSAQAAVEATRVMQGQLDQMKDTHLLTETHSLATNAEKQASATNRLAIAAKRSADIAQSQQASPWIGVEQDSLTVSSPEYTWNQAPPSTRPNISFPINFRMKNFGSAPALHVHPEATVVAVRLPALQVREWEDDPKRETNSVIQYAGPPCPLSNSEEEVQRNLKGGGVILPGDERKAGYDQLLQDEHPELTILGAVYVSICITYATPNGQWHHSGYGFMPNFSLNDKPVPIQGHPGWAYIPVRGFFLLTSNAN